MAEELNPYDNLYYEICNEPSRHDDPTEENEKSIIAWQAHLARILREAEARLPNRHLIAVNAHFEVRLPGASKSDDPSSGHPSAGHPEARLSRHDDLAYFENPDVDIINYHYISAKEIAQDLHFTRLKNEPARPGLIRPFLRRRDAYRKPIVFDETYSGIVRGSPERYGVNRAEAWEMMLSGGAGYSNLDWTFTQEDETGRGRNPIGDGRRLDGGPYRQWLAILRKLLGGYDVAALVPAEGLVQQSIAGYGWAASTDGRTNGPGRYILYLVDEDVYRLKTCRPGPLSLSASLPAGRYTVQVFDPRTGKTEHAGDGHSDGETDQAAGPAMALEIPSFSEDVAVLIDSVD